MDSGENSDRGAHKVEHRGDRCQLTRVSVLVVDHDLTGANEEGGGSRSGGRNGRGRSRNKQSGARGRERASRLKLWSTEIRKNARGYRGDCDKVKF